MEKETEKILSSMDQFYYFLADKLPARQDNIFKTYLWLSSIVISLNAVIIEKKEIEFSSIEGMLCFFSVATSFVSLIYSINAMRGQINLKHPDLSNILQYLKNDAYDKNEIMNEMATIQWNIIQDQMSEKHRRGLHLRNVSYLIIGSLGFLGLTAISILINVK